MVKQGVLHPEALQRPDHAGTGGRHHQQRTFQADTGQRVTTGDVPGGREHYCFPLIDVAHSSKRTGDTNAANDSVPF